LVKSKVEPTKFSIIVKLKSCIKTCDPNLISYKVIRMNNQSPKKVLDFPTKWHPLCPSFGHPRFPFPHFKFPLHMHYKELCKKPFKKTHKNSWRSKVLYMNPLGVHHKLSISQFNNEICENFIHS
jgi:hypothetical protein